MDKSYFDNKSVRVDELLEYDALEHFIKKFSFNKSFGDIRQHKNIFFNAGSAVFQSNFEDEEFILQRQSHWKPLDMEIVMAAYLEETGPQVMKRGSVRGIMRPHIMLTVKKTKVTAQVTAAMDPWIEAEEEGDEHVNQEEVDQFTKEALAKYG